MSEPARRNRGGEVRYGNLEAVLTSSKKCHNVTSYRSPKAQLAVVERNITRAVKQRNDRMQSCKGGAQVIDAERKLYKETFERESSDNDQLQTKEQLRRPVTAPAQRNYQDEDDNLSKEILTKTGIDFKKSSKLRAEAIESLLNKTAASGHQNPVTDSSAQEDTSPGKVKKGRHSDKLEIADRTRPVSSLGFRPPTTAYRFFEDLPPEGTSLPSGSGMKLAQAKRNMDKTPNINRVGSQPSGLGRLQTISASSHSGYQKPILAYTSPRHRHSSPGLPPSLQVCLAGISPSEEEASPHNTENASEGSLDEGFFLTSVALTENTEQQRSLAKAIILGAYALYLYGKVESAIEHFQAAVTIVEELNDYAFQGILHHHLGNAKKALSAYEEALDEHRKGIECAKRVDDHCVEARCLKGMGIIYQATGDLAGAQRLHEAALNMALATSDKDLQARCCGNLGNVLRMKKKFEEAVQYHNMDLRLSKQLDCQVGQARAAINLSIAYEEQGREAQYRTYAGMGKSLAAHAEYKDITEQYTSSVGNIYLQLQRQDSVLKDLMIKAYEEAKKKLKAPDLHTGIQSD